jgi:phosphoribosylanthranilate isomerase
VTVVRVKVCGLTRTEDARAAHEAGADYLGLVFADSRRRLEGGDARRLIEAVPEARWVGVFAGWGRARTLTLARALGLGTVQLHGDEDPAMAQELHSAGLAVWQAVGVGEPADWDVVGKRLVELDGCVELLLLDRRMAGSMGGGGVPFAWRSAPPSLAGTLSRSRLGLSGGLSADNVGAALTCLPAQLVDASSSLESAPGVKDAEHVREFVRAVRGAVTASEPGSAG